MKDLLKNERVVSLGNNISVVISDEYNFSSDTIILADFCLPKNKEKIVELGTGCGVLVLFLVALGKQNSMIAIDIQKTACDMLKKSIKLNKINNIEVVNADLRNLSSEINGSFDLVVSNPPYKLFGSGKINDIKEKAIANHEIFCTIDDITKTASNLLKNGGRFCACQRVDRLCDMLESMRKNNIEPKKIRFVYNNANSPSKLFLIEGKKAGRPGLINMPPLILTENNGEKSSEVKRIYKFCEE